jgi:hypothetical protein
LCAIKIFFGDYMPAELKPLRCPFCGGDGEIEATQSGFLGQCSNIDCNAHPSTDYENTHSDALRIWNQRADIMEKNFNSIQQLKAEIAALVSNCEVNPTGGHYMLSFTDYERMQQLSDV